MRVKNTFLLAFFIGIIFSFSSCESSTNVTIEESFQELKNVTPISGVTIESMEVIQGNSLDSYLAVRLNNGKKREAWCIEWNEEEAFGLQNGAKLYTTKGHKEWKKLNYFMSKLNDFRANDPDLTSRDIQVVIWSLVNNPEFDVDKIAEYENIDPRIYKDGQPLFDVQKVKSIVHQVESHLANTQKTLGEESGVTVIENDGQTIILGDETAYAVKTLDQTEVDSDYSTCFNEEIIENVSFNNWGWTNGPLSDPSGELIYDIYAGAGQCDLDKGTRVGELIVNYANGTLTVTYRMIGETYTLTETHLYAGNDPYPVNRGSGNYTVAPGHYGNQNTHDNVTEYTYVVDGLSGDIYFIAQAVVNGFNQEAD